MKLRCLLGFHGPNWTIDAQFLGPYSHRRVEEGFVRICPHCNARWEGSLMDRHVGGGVRVCCFGPWTKVKP